MSHSMSGHHVKCEEASRWVKMVLYIVRFLLQNDDEKRKYWSSPYEGAAEDDYKIQQLQSKLDETAKELVCYTRALHQL